MQPAKKQQKSGTSASTCALTTHPSHPSVSILPRSSPLAISCSSERWEPPARSSPPSILHPFSRHRRNVQVWLVERLHTLSLPLGMGSMPQEVDARVALHSMICDLFLLSMGKSTHTEGPAPPYLAEGFTSKRLHICPPRFEGWIETSFGFKTVAYASPACCDPAKAFAAFWLTPISLSFKIFLSSTTQGRAMVCKH